SIIIVYIVVLFMFFFFFQAEDGIRDDLVTGVQTCALPICARLTTFPRSFLSSGTEAWQRLREKVVNLAPGSGTVIIPRQPGTHRSEERRVGKECRYRWGEGG